MIAGKNLGTPDTAADSAALAEAAFSALCDALQAGLPKPAAAQKVLSAAFLPLDMAARALFERDVANLLVQGWRPGHDLLFDTACNLFGWGDHPAALGKLGPAGDVLGAAIHERLAFHDRPSDVLARQRKLVRRLRNPNPPTPTLRRDERPLLRVLVRRYPHWLRIVTSMDNVEKWLGGPDALLAAYVAPEASLSAPSDDNPIVQSLRTLAAALWLILMAWDYLR